MHKKIESMNRIVDFAIGGTFACLGLVAIFQITIILYVNKRIINPILQIRDNMLKMAQGEFDSENNVEKDETEIGRLAFAMENTKVRTANVVEDINYMMGELAEGNFTAESKEKINYIGVYKSILEALNSLRGKQSNMLSQVDVVADQVLNGSEQLSNGAQALAQGAIEQASSTEALQAVIDDISQKIEMNTERIVNATHLVENTGKEVLSGNEKMSEMLQAMKDISEKSNQISNIIKTIDEIAFQTNILALNAAVEAARAGSAGKGFAVVADEVRNLASKSAVAAQNTTDLIANSISSVEKGAKLADETAASLEVVTTNAEEIVKIINEIKSESEAQSADISQIVGSVGQISSVVQTNSATAEESAAASEELLGQATALKDLVGQFRLLKQTI